MAGDLVECPICDSFIDAGWINQHLDSKCMALEPPSSSSSVRSAQGPALAPIFTGNPPPSDKTQPPGKRRQSGEGVGSLTRRKRPASPLPEENRRLPKHSALKGVEPLAERMRPTTLDEFFGHESLLSPSSGALRALLLSSQPGSFLLWGPPGTGKTTLARLMANHTDASFHACSATNTSIVEVRKIVDGALGQLKLTGKRTLLFVDEIHRYSKSQLDAFLPGVESGVIQLVGATSENPSFTINRALLSRLKIFALNKLTEEALKSVLKRAVRLWKAERTDEKWPAGREGVLGMNGRMMDFLASVADGDCRVALNSLETALQLVRQRYSEVPPSTTDLEDDEQESLMAALKGTLSLRYDRTGDDHYEMISALHKSVRASDGSAALYWLARMLTAGEDPLYVVRRLIVMASEDIGLADNQALPLAIATLHACQQVGMPECRINLAHCVAYLAEAPKSTRAYKAYNQAVAACEGKPLYPVPSSMRNSVTRLDHQLGHGRGYSYDPTYSHPVLNECLPPELKSKSSYSNDVDEKILKPEGNETDKKWDEQRLVAWEKERNEGRPWEGRSAKEFEDL